MCLVSIDIQSWTKRVRKSAQQVQFKHTYPRIDNDQSDFTPDVYMSTSSEGVASVDSIAAHLNAGASSAEIAWLRRCLPIFVQPEVDIKNCNELVKTFFRFERDDQSGRLICKLCIVFAGESSYNRAQEEIENTLATFCYRTFNRRTYKRTADINYLEFRYIDRGYNS